MAPSQSAPVPNSPATVATYQQRMYQPVLSYNYNQNMSMPDNNTIMTNNRSSGDGKSNSQYSQYSHQSYHDYVANKNKNNISKKVKFNHNKRKNKKSDGGKSKSRSKSRSKSGSKHSKQNSKSSPYSQQSSSPSSNSHSKKKRKKRKKTKNKSKFGAYIEKKNLMQHNDDKNDENYKNRNKSFADYQKKNDKSVHSKTTSMSTAWTESTYNTDAETLKSAGFVISAQYMYDEDSL